MSLFILYCESAHYCGYGQHFVVEAPSEEEAEVLVESAADEYFCELYADEMDEDDLHEDISYTVCSVEPFHEGHDDWQFYKDYSQSQFYTKVNVNE